MIIGVTSGILSSLGFSLSIAKATVAGGVSQLSKIAHCVHIER